MRSSIFSEMTCKRDNNCSSLRTADAENDVEADEDDEDEDDNDDDDDVEVLCDRFRLFSVSMSCFFPLLLRFCLLDGDADDLVVGEAADDEDMDPDALLVLLSVL